MKFYSKTCGLCGRTEGLHDYLDIAVCNDAVPCLRRLEGELHGVPWLKRQKRANFP